MAYPTCDTSPFTYAQGLAIDELSAEITSYLSQQHKNDGSHAAVTADSLVVSGNVSVAGTVTLATAVITTLTATNETVATLHVTGVSTLDGDVKVTTRMISPFDDGLTPLFSLSAPGSVGSRGGLLRMGQEGIAGSISISPFLAKFGASGFSGCEMDVYGDVFVLKPSTGAVEFQVSSTDGSLAVNTNKFTVDGSNGNTVIGGSGTLTVPGAINANGTVIFPATQNPSANPNSLDDYEEGTWTPSDGSGAGLSLTVSGASYVKIGQQVMAAMNIVYPVTASGANSQINGLPFTARSGGQTATASVGYSTFGAIDVFIADGTTTLNFYTAAGVALTNLQLSGQTIVVTLPYRASA